MTPEQAAGLVPGKVQKIVVSGDDCVIELFAGTKKFLVLHPGRIEVVDEKPTREEGDPPSLQGLLRKELQPAILSRIDRDGPGGDRLLFARKEGPARVVVVEADARDPRWLVLAVSKEGQKDAEAGDPGERILACSPGTRAVDGRDLRRGRLYEPPRTKPAPMAAPGEPQQKPKPIVVVDPALAQLRARLKAELDRKRRLVKALDGDLHKHGDPTLLEEEGELLKTVMGTLKRGAATVDVTGFDGVPRTLTLDPARDAKQNLLLRFTKAKKARTAIARTQPRLDDARATVAALEAARAALAATTGGSGDDVDARAHVEDLLASGGPTARRRAAIETVRASGKRQPWRAFGVDANKEGDVVVVRVGRGAKDNDALVKASKGHDLWLHARDATGAHVVIPSNGGPVADDVLRDAALLAAWFSTLRGERTVVVQHTRVKNLKKPGAGAPAGLWLVGHESTLTLRVDDERTAALLKREVAAG